MSTPTWQVWMKGQGLLCGEKVGMPTTEAAARTRMDRLVASRYEVWVIAPDGTKILPDAVAPNLLVKYPDAVLVRHTKCGMFGALSDLLTTEDGCVFKVDNAPCTLDEYVLNIADRLHEHQFDEVAEDELVLTFNWEGDIGLYETTMTKGQLRQAVLAQGRTRLVWIDSAGVESWVETYALSKQKINED